jgi:hypothetical protein
LRRDAASAVAAARWDPVLNILGTSAAVAQALTTPLLVGLARTVYNPRPDEHIGALPDPAELCDRTRFPSRVAIQEHLFDAFIPAAYRPHPNPARRGSWTPRQAERWLVFLARHLEQDLQGKTDFAWWELHQAVPDRLLGLGVGLAVGLMAGGVAGLVAGITTEQSATTPARGLNWKAPGRSDLRFGLVIGLVAGVAAGIVIGLVAGVVIGVVIGLVYLLTEMLAGRQADLTVTTEPLAALTQDRRTYWTLGLVDGLAAGVAFGLTLGLIFGLRTGLGAGIRTGLVAGVGSALAGGLAIPTEDTTWGTFLLVRCWLALRRRLPWRLMSFLADAHKQRGVLRQAGAVYQFRHIDLQRRLATRPAS